MMRVGVVCEGSHDLLFLRPVIAEIVQSRHAQTAECYALQPRIDATSMQIDGGGYPAVVEWIKAKSGDLLKKYLQVGLFESSDVYDVILVHLDGDVSDICVDFTSSRYNDHDGTVVSRLSSLTRWIRALANLPDEYLEKVLFALPMRQTESWVLATLRPNAKDLENRDLKLATKRLLRREFGGDARSQVAAAGEIAASKIDDLRGRLKSFERFAAQW